MTVLVTIRINGSFKFKIIIHVEILSLPNFDGQLMKPAGRKGQNQHLPLSQPRCYYSEEQFIVHKRRLKCYCFLPISLSRIRLLGKIQKNGFTKSVSVRVNQRKEPIQPLTGLLVSVFVSVRRQLVREKASHERIMSEFVSG